LENSNSSKALTSLKEEKNENKGFSNDEDLDDYYDNFYN